MLMASSMLSARSRNGPYYTFYVIIKAIILLIHVLYHCVLWIMLQ
ncbi:hypothetical protein TrispH2_003224 [Trichoplax sp. H2]|nr:hypothetical protein TrispH2_003224 [Trichoplax sp. H2]|eukprot:RDD44274.1 hypothetical protein TrispH2_003224 [Trichoplax sp. H2]